VKILPKCNMLFNREIRNRYVLFIRSFLILNAFIFVIEALGCFALNELALYGLPEIFTHLFLKQNRLFRERKRRLKCCGEGGKVTSPR